MTIPTVGLRAWSGYTGARVACTSIGHWQEAVRAVKAHLYDINVTRCTTGCIVYRAFRTYTAFIGRYRLPACSVALTR